VLLVALAAGIGRCYRYGDSAAVGALDLQNRGTALAIASTPLSAEHPEEVAAIPAVGHSYRQCHYRCQRLAIYGRVGWIGESATCAHRNRQQYASALTKIAVEIHDETGQLALRPHSVRTCSLSVHAHPRTVVLILGHAYRRRRAPTIHIDSARLWCDSQYRFFSSRPAGWTGG
jgi:hypothetical protein